MEDAMAVNVSAIGVPQSGVRRGSPRYPRRDWIGTSLSGIELTEELLIRDVESTFVVLNETSKASAYDRYG